MSTLPAETYSDELMTAIIKAQEGDPLANDICKSLATKTAIPMDLDTVIEADTGDKDLEPETWSTSVGALIFGGRIYVPAADTLQQRVISLFHDNPESGHFGALRTKELVSRDFYWPAMDSTIRKYVAACEVCHRVKPHGTRGMAPICLLSHQPSLGKGVPWTQSPIYPRQRTAATLAF